MPIIASALAAPSIRHGFFTRVGGVSDGAFDSLNCGFGSGDMPEKVAENRRRAVEEAVGREIDLVTGHQRHTADAVVVKKAWAASEAPVADGLVTNRPGLALGILTADCAPVLMADAEAGVIGAAHAGWRGAFDGILESTLDKMNAMGADLARTVAVVGPCIGKGSYEVGPEFRVRFLEADPANEEFFRPSARAGHALFDLAGYVMRRLQRAGLGYVGTTGGDTCAEPKRFYSYRRMTLDGGQAYGRELSLIALQDD
jgi:YfiH family protein